MGWEESDISLDEILSFKLDRYWAFAKATKELRAGTEEESIPAKEWFVRFLEPEMICAIALSLILKRLEKA